MTTTTHNISSPIDSYTVESTWAGRSSVFATTIWSTLTTATTSDDPLVTTGPSPEPESWARLASERWPLWFLLTIVVAVVVLNSLVLVAIVRYSKLHRTFHYLIASLLACDILYVTLVSPFAVVRTVTASFPFLSSWCAVWRDLDTVLTTVSIVHLSLGVCDCHAALLNPLKYQLRSVHWYAVLNVGAAWVLGVAVSIPCSVLHHVFYPDRLEDVHGCGSLLPEHVLTDAGLSFFLPMLCVLALCLWVARDIRHQQSVARLMQSEVSSLTTSNGDVTGYDHIENGIIISDGMLCPQNSFRSDSSSDSEDNSNPAPVPHMNGNVVHESAAAGIDEDVPSKEEASSKEPDETKEIAVDKEEDPPHAVDVDSDKPHVVPTDSISVAVNDVKVNVEEEIPSTISYPKTGIVDEDINQLVLDEELETEDPVEVVVEVDLHIDVAVDGEYDPSSETSDATGCFPQMENGRGDQDDTGYEVTCADGDYESDTCSGQLKQGKELLNEPVGDNDAPIDTSDTQHLVPPELLLGFDNPAMEGTPLADSIKVNIQDEEKEKESSHSYPPSRQTTLRRSSVQRSSSCDTPSSTVPKRSILRRGGTNRSTVRKSVKFANNLSTELALTKQTSVKGKGSKVLQRRKSPHPRKYSRQQSISSTKLQEVKQAAEKPVVTAGKADKNGVKKNTTSTGNKTNKQCKNLEVPLLNCMHTVECQAPLSAYMSCVHRSQSSRMSHRIQRQKNALQLIVALVVFTLLVAAPYHLTWSVLSLCETCRGNIPSVLLLVFEWIIHGLLIIKPLLYLIFVKELRTGMRKLRCS